MCSQLVEVIVQGGDALLQSFALSRFGDDSGRFGFGDEGIGRQHLPVIEHALRERLASGVGAQIGRETCTIKQLVLHFGPVSTK